MDKQSKILITGASGLIGSALVRLLRSEGYENVLTPSHRDLMLLNYEEIYYGNTLDYLESEKPEYIFHLAACVGGIKSNNENPAQFIYNNTLMQCNIFEASRRVNVKKILFPGSACAYPRDAEQPIKETAFLTGIPESTNLAYAVAKQNGIVMAQSYAKEYGMNVVLPMVANTYGVRDRSSHVIPNLIQRFDDANKKDDKDVEIWGSGNPSREFIYADDVAEAFLFLMLNYNSPEIINVGTMDEISIVDLAQKVASLMEYNGNISYDNTKPDGAQRKVLDCAKIFQIGWKPKVCLEDGLRRVVEYYYAS